MLSPITFLSYWLIFVEEEEEEEGLTRFFVLKFVDLTMLNCFDEKIK